MNAQKPGLLALKIALPLAVLAIAAFATWRLIQDREVPQKEEVETIPPLVEVRELQPTDHVVVVRGEGTVEAGMRSELSAQVMGRIEFISPKLTEGSSFAANEELLRIEPDDYEVALAQDKANLESAKVALAQTEKDASLAREEWQRLGLDKEPDPLLLRIPQLAEARARVQAANEAVRKAENDLARCRIRAPYDGRVIARHADLGEILQPGVRIADVHTIEYSEVHMPIRDQELQWLELPADLAQTSLDDRPKVRLVAEFGGKQNTWYGFVDRVAAQLDPTTRMVELIVRVPEPYRTDSAESHYVLPLGLFVHMEIEGRRLSDVFAIPRTALRRGSQLLLVDDEQRIRIQQVDILTGQGDVVLVRGLRPGSRLCLTPVDLPVDGMRVRLGDGAAR